LLSHAGVWFTVTQTVAHVQIDKTFLIAQPM
jgi:hypothetical protein